MKLRSCPFCGCEDVRLQIYDKKGWWRDSITCPNCGIGFTTGMFGGGYDIVDVEKTSIKKWNNRINIKEKPMYNCKNMCPPWKNEYINGIYIRDTQLVVWKYCPWCGVTLINEEEELKKQLRKIYIEACRKERLTSFNSNICAGANTVLPFPVRLFISDLIQQYTITKRSRDD